MGAADRKNAGSASVDGIVVAVAQVGARVGDIAANVALADRYVARAAARGAHLVVFPESFVQGYSLSRSVLDLAEPIVGPAIRALAGIAEANGVAIVAGMIETNPAHPHRPFNTAVVVGRRGGVIGAYRKTHLFDREADAFAAGIDYPVFDVPLRPDRPPLRVGVCICYDVEFPEVPRLLAIGGAQLIAVPSADMEPYRAQQAANLMSRAIENNVHVALANTVDRRSAVTFFGGSGIAAPDGTLVSAGYLRPRLAVATLTDAAVNASGGAGSNLRERRVETFRGLIDRS
jgi:predicted amidohydrolase